jgi:acyl dehydratase
VESEARARSSLVGTEVDTVRYEVEAGKIREFAVSSRAGDPVHTDPLVAKARGFDHVLATATHSVVAGHYRDQRGFVARLGLDIRRIVVGSTRWEYLRPLASGDVLHGTRRVVGDETKTSSTGSTMRLVTLETDYVDADGQVSLKQREVLIERGLS